VRLFWRAIGGDSVRRLFCVLAALAAFVHAAPAAACTGDCDGDGMVTIDEILRAVAQALGGDSSPPCDAADANGDGLVTVDELVRAVQNALTGCPPTPTPSATQPSTPTPTVTAPVTETVSPTVSPTPLFTTPTETPPPDATLTPSQDETMTPASTATSSPTLTATSTPTGGPLGTRRFSIRSSSSLLLTVFGNGSVTGVVGFTGHLDLRAGVPDPVTGQARIDVTGASEFISLSLPTGTICIRPLVDAPVLDAGLIDCDGGAELGTDTSQDHNIGVVGVDGFTAEDCAAAGGTVEPAESPHPQVCNGPVVVGRRVGVDAGAGAVVIGPDAVLGTQGLPAEVSILAPGAECADGPRGSAQPLGLISGPSGTRIFNRDNQRGQTLPYENPGENFSCAAWSQEDGPGKLILTIPTLHGIVVQGSILDVINIFVLDD
jgi:hypothetical protein